LKETASTDLNNFHLKNGDAVISPNPNPIQSNPWMDQSMSGL